MLRRLLLLAALSVTVGLTTAACHHGPTEPDDQLAARGRLSGVVTIGPNCPVETAENPCPTPPSAYAARKVLVYDAAQSRLLATVDIDGHGFYLIDVAAGIYTIDIRRSGLDRSADVPAKVTIRAGLVTTLDIRIDTGIR